MKSKETYLVLLIIIIGIIVRFLPHLPNFVPITAIALFGGRYFSKKWSYIIPLSVMIISDYFLGFSPVTPFVYAGLIVAVILGIGLKKNSNWKNIILAALFSSVAFFIISNLGVWIGGWYTYTWSGLVHCFVMAIPFFRYSLAGDLFYTTVMFGAYELIRQHSWFKKVITA